MSFWRTTLHVKVQRPVDARAPAGIGGAVLDEGGAADEDGVGEGRREGGMEGWRDGGMEESRSGVILIGVFAKTPHPGK